MNLSIRGMVRSLRVKSVLLVLILLLLVFSISSGVLILRSINSQTSNLISQARSYAKLTANPIGDTYSLYFNSGYLKFAELLNQFLVLNPDIKKIQIISVTGEVLFDSDQLLDNRRPTETTVETDPEILDKIRANVGSELPKRSPDSQPQQLIEPYVEDFGAHPFSIRYFVSYETISESIFETITTIALLSLVFLATAIVLIIFAIDRSLINPIETVIEGAQKIRRGDLSHKIEVNTKDEVSDLALAVNDMAATLKKNIEDLQALDKLKDEFVFLASHNLRTPLTIIKGYIASLLKAGSLPPKVRRDVSNMDQASDDLEAITESLINLVTLEKGKQPGLVSEVDIINLLREVSEQYRPKASEKRVSFTFEFPTTELPKIKVDASRIRQALGSLIDNAVKFNKEGGNVIMRAQKEGRYITVSVEDTGIGIPKEEARRIFQKFHRATDTLTYDYEGVGLGLYLTKLIIEAHLGRIWFESAPGEGTIFYVKLPIKVVR